MVLYNQPRQGRKYVCPFYYLLLFFRWFYWYFSLTCRNASHSTPVTDAPSPRPVLCCMALQRDWIAFIHRLLLVPSQEVLGILMSSYCQHSTLTLTAQLWEKVMQSESAVRCRPVWIGHQGDWRAERAADGRCVFLTACLSRLWPL